MAYYGSHLATMDKGRVSLPAEYAAAWPSQTLSATLEFTEAGLIIACYERTPDLRDYRERRRKDYVRMLLGKGMKPVDACAHALHDVKSHIRFIDVPIVDRSVALDQLIADAKLSQPLRWVGFVPCFNDKHGKLDGIELWSENRYQQAMRDVSQELHVTQNKRVGWPGVA